MKEFLLRLSSRERALILGAAGFFFLVLFLRLLALPVWEQRDRLHAAAARKKAEVAQFEVLRARYEELADRAALAEAALAAGGGASLLTQVESLAREEGVKDRIASMKPQRSQLESKMWESSVEVRLEKVDLREAVQFLRRLETSARPVRVKRVQLKTRFDDPALLDATLLVSALDAPVPSSPPSQALPKAPPPPTHPQGGAPG